MSREEVPPLADHYLEALARNARKPRLTLGDEALEALLVHRWPGNVRQLASEMRRLVPFCKPGSVVRPVADLSPHVTSRALHQAGPDAAVDGLGPRHLATALVAEDDLHAFSTAVLDAAITLTEADAGTLQILEGDHLRLLVTRGFSSLTTDRLETVAAASDPSCATALASHVRSFVDFDDPATLPSESMRMHLEAGHRSGQSTPLLTRGGRPIGMLSTHWRRRQRRPSERQLSYLDLLARQAADILERRQIEAELRDQHRFITEVTALVPHLIYLLDLEGRRDLYVRRTARPS